jgi:hypothetical protein
MNIETSITIISTNLNKHILDKYKDYHVIDDNFTYQELLTYKKVIFFNVLNNLDKVELDKLFNYLKEKDIKYINIANNLELCLYTNYLIVMDEKNILIEGSTIEVLKNDKLLKRLGFELPFMVELSLLLRDYNLVDKVYLDYKELEGALWN